MYFIAVWKDVGALVVFGGDEGGKFTRFVKIDWWKAHTTLQHRWLQQLVSFLWYRHQQLLQILLHEFLADVEWALLIFLVQWLKFRQVFGTSELVQLRLEIALEVYQVGLAILGFGNGIGKKVASFPQRPSSNLVVDLLESELTSVIILGV